MGLLSAYPFPSPIKSLLPRTGLEMSSLWVVFIVPEDVSCRGKTGLIQL